MTTRLLHLVGSPTSTFFHDLSRLYARGALEVAAELEDVTSVVADVAPDGTWRLTEGLDPAALADAEPLDAPTALGRIVDLAPDVALPQMFCLPGMTAYRGLLEVLGIPYVGNRPGVMALAAHKARTRAVVAAAGVAVPAGETVGAGGRATIPPPVVVKPVDADNSSGVAVVDDPADLAAALDGALAHADEALVETYVPLGREVRCATVELGDELVVLPLEEYAPDRVRTAADKLARRSDGELELVAKGGERAWIVDSADPVCVPVAAAARRCHQAMGCRDHGLFDFRIDPEGRPWFLEAGLYCSFSPASVVTTMAVAAGVPAPDLLADAVARRLRRTGPPSPDVTTPGAPSPTVRHPSPHPTTETT